MVGRAAPRLGEPQVRVAPPLQPPAAAPLPLKGSSGRRWRGRSLLVASSCRRTCPRPVGNRKVGRWVGLQRAAACSLPCIPDAGQWHAAARQCIILRSTTKGSLTQNAQPVPHRSPAAVHSCSHQAWAHPSRPASRPAAPPSLPQQQVAPAGRQLGPQEGRLGLASPEAAGLCSSWLAGWPADQVRLQAARLLPRV